MVRPTLKAVRLASMRGAGPRPRSVLKTLYSQQNLLLLTRLRQARQDAGLTQRQLAAKLEASQDEISKCETGVRRLDVVELKLWVEALGLRLPEFLETMESSALR